MYGHGLLTHGAVIATMIATMGDESFVMLAMLPGQALLTLGLLFVLGVFVGALTDTVARRWIKLTPDACDALDVHTAEACNCCPRGRILHQWKQCTAARGIMTAVLTLFVLGLASGQLGSPDRQWIRVTLHVVAAVALFVVVTVPDHFIEEHLWKHVARRHVPRIFLWTLGALGVIYVLTENLCLGGGLQEGSWILLIIACLVGIIPESGPHLIFVTLYAQGSIPFSILLASSIVQDGHGMLPMLAQSRRTFLAVKAVNFLAGLLVGTLAMLSGI